MLRLAERTDQVAHIPRSLYHWRAHTGSSASGDQAKPYAYLAQPGAIAEHLRRSRIDAEIQFGHLPGVHRVVHRVKPSSSVDLVLALTDEHGLTRAAVSWLSQPHPTWQVVVAASPPVLLAATTALTAAGVTAPRITTIPTDPTTDRATALAAAAHAAQSEHLLLMPTLAVGLTHDWLTRLIGYSSQQQIAAAGPVVLSPDGRIQEAGIAIPDGIPLPLHHGSDAAFASPSVVMNVSAVSGVFAHPPRDLPRARRPQPRTRRPRPHRLLPTRHRRRSAHRHHPRRPPSRHRPRPRHQRPAQTLAAPPHLGPNPHPRPLLQPQLPNRPRRL